MRPLLLFTVLAFAFGSRASAQVPTPQTMATIGVTALLAQDPTITGSGVDAVQGEATGGPGQFEVNPNRPAQPVSLFTWHSSSGSSGTFPNSVGSESDHADFVSQSFYSSTTGVAPGLSHVTNYEMNDFYSSVIQRQVALTAPVVNQSFVFGTHDALVDLTYDDYIARYHSVIASAVGNGGPIYTPADCYNGLGVGAYGGQSSTGPTADGRCKPDITAPSNVTSFSTPLVTGAAALLIQAGSRAGADATVAVDSRTVKALLLTGAVKPSGWTHTAAAPLDHKYGAGVVNVFNSWTDLAAGRIPPVATGLARNHLPLTNGTAVAAPRGWDYRTFVSSPSEHGVSHYRFTTSATGALIATLVWNRQERRIKINRLYLYLYDSTGHLLASSTSIVDNVQHLYVASLPPATYELEVLKVAGPIGASGIVSTSETYALAWDFER
jgi:hypothetical protein